MKTLIFPGCILLMNDWELLMRCDWLYHVIVCLIQALLLWTGWRFKKAWMLVIGKLSVSIMKSLHKKYENEFLRDQFKINIVWIYIFLLFSTFCLRKHFCCFLFGLDLVLSLCLDFIPMQCCHCAHFCHMLWFLFWINILTGFQKVHWQKITLCNQVTLLFKSLVSVRLSVCK